MASRRAAPGLAAVLLLVCGASAQALDFKAFHDESGNPVVVVMDRDPCPPLRNGKHDPTCGFFEGDTARLAAAMRTRQFSQVWLDSRGGMLDEGIQMGMFFRQAGLRVHVPAGATCASSCTVAFMGGLIRSVDPEGRFLVHSASTVLGGVSDDVRDKLLRDPELALSGLADHYYQTDRKSAIDLMSYFQLMLNGTPNVPLLTATVMSGPPRLPYVTNGDLKRDAQKIRSDGPVVMQDIVMSLERQSVGQAIEAVRPSLDSLGARAAPALKLLETMYSSRITAVAELSQQELYELGYTNVRPH